MKKYILLLILCIFPLNVFAKDELKIDCDKEVFKELEKFTCRTNVNTSFEFNKITFDIDLSSGLSLDEVRTNFTNLWNLSINKNTITAETKNNILVSNLQQFGILLLEGVEYGNKDINLKNIVLFNTKDNKILELDNVNQNIKILSSENKLSNIYINDKEISSFNSEIYSYKIILPTDKLNITVDLLDKNSLVSGTGEKELNENSYLTVVPIKVSSESEVSRIYYLYIINDVYQESKITANLIELKTKNEVLDFNFNPNVYEYNIELDSKTQSLELNIKLEDGLSLIKDYGNRTIEIEDGDNDIIIKIKNNEGEIQTYVINVTRLLSNKSSNFYLKSLIINKYDLKFNKRVRNYNLAIKKSVKKLDITAIPEDNNSSISIIGNEDLVDGSIIKVIVKAENESKYTYSIQIGHKTTNFLIPFLLLILFGSLLLIVFKLIKKYNILIKIKKRFNFKKLFDNKKLVIVKSKNKKVKSSSKKSNSSIKSKATPKKKTNKKVNSQGSKRVSDAVVNKSSKQSPVKPKANSKSPAKASVKPKATPNKGTVKVTNKTNKSSSVKGNSKSKGQSSSSAKTKVQPKKEVKKNNNKSKNKK
ncbi:MAG: cadherin-like beta sandwich domain-containing protein [Bacilli bacterium]|nr:cadherin-like beta sandwich domain-containing protein [Bacilli bacterium]